MTPAEKHKFEISGESCLYRRSCNCGWGRHLLRVLRSPVRASSSRSGGRRDCFRMARWRSSVGNDYGCSRRCWRMGLDWVAKYSVKGQARPRDALRYGNYHDNSSNGLSLANDPAAAGPSLCFKTLTSREI